MGNADKTMRGARWAWVPAWVALAAAVSGCDDERSDGGLPPGVPPGVAPSGGKPAKGPAAAAGASAAARERPLVFRDEDFVESERNRDPFRSYMESFSIKAPEEVQRQVVMGNTPIDDMRLVAIISGTNRPRAMIVDPAGVGHVVERGMYVGRAQVIQASGSVSMTLNWRVDRIRDNEVVLTRQDPVDPSRAPLSRVIPLHDELAVR